MADHVPYTPGSGVTIAADEIGGVQYQRVKLVHGADGTNLGDIGPTNPLPVTGSVAISGPAQVSGTVTVANGVSVSAQVSGTVSVNTVGTLLGTVEVNVVAGGAGGGSVTTAGPSISATGQVVWIAGGQGTTATPVVVTGTVSAGAGTTVISGTVTVANLPGSTTGSSGMSGVLVWLGASQTVLVSTQISGTVTINNGASVTIQQGASVSAVVSGTVTAILPGSTTGSSGMSGVLVWLGASQTIIVSTLVSGTVSVNTVGTLLGTVEVNVVAGGAGGGSVTTAVPSVSATGQIMWIVGGQSTTAAPVFVSQINPPAGGGGSVTTAVPSVSATGQIMWVVGGQSTTAAPVFVSHVGTQLVSIIQTSVVAQVSGTVTAVLPGSTTGSSGMSGVLVWLGASQTVNVGSITTILGTQIVSVVPGLSVSAVVSGTVTAVLPGSTTGSSGMSGVLVWLGASQTVLISTQVSGTISVSNQVNISGTIDIGVSETIGTIIAVSGVTAVSVVSTIGTLLGTVGVKVLSTTAELMFTTLQPSASMTGPGIWVINTASATVSVSVTVSGTISVLDAQHTNVLIIVSSTGLAAFATTVQFTLYVSMSQSLAGTSAWVVPAGKTFRICNIDFAMQNSVTTTPVLARMYVLQSSATPTLTATVPIAAGAIALAPNVTAPQGRNLQVYADISAGVTVAIAASFSTVGGIHGLWVYGYLYP